MTLRKHVRNIIAGLGLVFFSSLSFAAIQVVDDNDRTVTLEKPAQRIISLTPHLTELLFYVGAGDQVVGTTSWSNYPEQAKQIPRIGDYFSLNLEVIVSMQPDVVLAWIGGPTLGQVQWLERQGIPVFYSDPLDFSGIEQTLIDLGRLTGHEKNGQQQSRQFALQLKTLADQYQHKTPVQMFYQVGVDPLYTISDGSFINDVIELCGAVNLFAGLAGASPQVAREAVLLADPDIIVIQTEDPSLQDYWLKDPTLGAVQNQQIYLLNPDNIARPTPSLIAGARQICRWVDQARSPPS